MRQGRSVGPVEVNEFFITLNSVILYLIQSFAIPCAGDHITQLASVSTIKLLLYIQKFHPQSYTWL